MAGGDLLDTFIISPLNKLGEAAFGAVEKAGETAFAIVDGVGGAIFGAKEEKSDVGAMVADAGAISASPPPVKTIQHAMVDDTVPLASVVAQPSIQSEIRSAVSNAMDRINNMVDYGKDTSYLASAELPSVQAGLPMGRGGQAQGAQV